MTPKPPKNRNYKTPGRIAAIEATKTQPGAPRAKSRPPKEEPVARWMPPAEPAEPDFNHDGRKWIGEHEFETDPEFPPATKRLKDHTKSAGDLATAAAGFRDAGFLPNAISRLIGLHPADIATLLKSTPAN